MNDGTVTPTDPDSRIPELKDAPPLDRKARHATREVAHVAAAGISAQERQAAAELGAALDVAVLALAKEQEARAAQAVQEAQAEAQAAGVTMSGEEQLYFKAMLLKPVGKQEVQARTEAWLQGAAGGAPGTSQAPSPPPPQGSGEAAALRHGRGKSPATESPAEKQARQFKEAPPRPAAPRAKSPPMPSRKFEDRGAFSGAADEPEQAEVEEDYTADMMEGGTGPPCFGNQFRDYGQCVVCGVNVTTDDGCVKKRGREGYTHYGCRNLHSSERARKNGRK